MVLKSNQNIAWKDTRLNDDYKKKNRSARYTPSIPIEILTTKNGKITKKTKLDKNKKKMNQPLINK